MSIDFFDSLIISPKALLNLADIKLTEDDIPLIKEGNIFKLLNRFEKNIDVLAAVTLNFCKRTFNPPIKNIKVPIDKVHLETKLKKFFILFITSLFELIKSAKILTILVIPVALAIKSKILIPEFLTDSLILLN